MKSLAFACAAFATVLLAGCTTLPAVPEMPAPAPVAPLVIHGALSEHGQHQRDAGLRAVAHDRNEEAYALWLPLAQAGHAESQYNLGLMTARGLGTPVDSEASLAWMRQAAASDYPPALLELGIRHATQDPPEALRLFLRAADLGDATAALHAGEMLAAGRDVERDTARGIDLLMQAAQSEPPSIKAQTILGRLYLGTPGVVRDPAQALYWLEQAAAAEECEAQYLIGRLHHQGLGVRKHLYKAMGWYLRAAQQGYAPAMNALGLLYRNGEGVKKNLAMARAYFEKAAARGDRDAERNLDKLVLAKSLRAIPE